MIYIKRDAVLSTLDRLGKIADESAGELICEIVRATLNAARNHVMLMEEKDIDKIERDLRDCRNELCLRCGDYKQRHNGACNGCRWLEADG